jgi:phosphoserine phosphatase
MCPAMSHPNGCSEHNLCKRNVLLHLCEQFDLPPESVLAVGDGEPDACMLAAAGISVAFEPKNAVVRMAAQHVLMDSLLEILPLVG